MRKRNNGYILLALLVITGLGSQVYNSTITSKERKYLHSELKSTKKHLIAATEDLSHAQLNFKPAPDSWSIRECVYHIALTEKDIWMLAEKTLKQPADAEKRRSVTITDDALMKMMKDRSAKAKAPENIDPSKASWTTTEQALEDFKAQRARLMKYVKTTTQDLRNHVVDDADGKMDVYQLLLIAAGHTHRHLQQIEEIKSHPKFPR